MIGVAAERGLVSIVTVVLKNSKFLSVKIFSTTWFQPVPQ
jgi:hypothetical protein